MSEGGPTYLPYLLRLWRVSDDNNPMWRASLQSVDTGEGVGFAGLEEWPPVTEGLGVAMGRRQPDYLSYLLRLWRVSNDDRPVWRASLQDAGTGKRTGFAGLNELFDFLRQQTSVVSNGNIDRADSRG